LEAVPSGASDPVTSAAETNLTKEEDGGAVNMLAFQALDGIKVESSAPQNTLWMRRKKSFKLKLEGISMRGKRRHANSAHEPTPGVQILELFENMMQARMESCERVSRLVRDAKTLKDDS